jgi:NADPH:quinone reductase-like Zn-dependent oxidoreductase
MPAEIKVIRFHEYGGPEKLVLETIARPAPKAGEVLIKVHFAGVNPVDWKFRAGHLKDFMPLQLPFVPGMDVSGIIEELGPDVKGLKTGQAVEDAGVKRGQTVAVLGAAGGVGLFAVQFARGKGAKVVGTASAANLEYVKALGADRAVDYAKGPLEMEIKAMDVVIDTVGGETLEKANGLLAKGGVLVTMAGQVSEEKAKAQGVKALSSRRGPTDKLKMIGEMAAAKSLRAEVGKVFPLAEARAAQELSQTRHGRGRIIVKVLA